MKVRFERGALADLAEIFAYVAADNRVAAVRLVVAFERVAASLSQSPHIGRALRGTHFRQWPVGSYLIVYEVTDTEVIILYVRHSARQRAWTQEEQLNGE
jgi:addiction module RelE/StbE family toxin